MYKGHAAYQAMGGFPAYLPEHTTAAKTESGSSAYKDTQDEAPQEGF